jgi:transposase-like protein
MTRDTTAPAASTTETMAFEGEDWFDPLEEAVRGKVRSFIEAILEEELETSLLRKRYERRSDGEAPAVAVGHRHGHRERTLTGTFGAASRRPRAVRGSGRAA